MKLHPHPRSVLLVGAGSRNDVAGALRNGAESVTAVEIDPVIIDIGRQLHPEKPYSNPRVRVVNDDARSFFATTDQKFDVIIRLARLAHLRLGDGEHTARPLRLHPRKP
ncbi:MAG: methyltransferase domain-containing protein [Gemmataceae bacterium]